MKYLLIIILAINIGYTCGIDTTANLNSCTVDDRVSFLVEKVRPSFKFVPNESYFAGESFESYTFTKEVPQAYEYLIIDPLLPLEELQTALDSWKDVETVRIDYWERLNDIEFLRASMNACNLNQPDAIKFVRDLKRDLDETKLTCLESHKVVLKEEDNVRKENENTRKAARTFLKNLDCTTIIDNNLSAVVINFMKAVCEAR